MKKIKLEHLILLLILLFSAFFRLFRLDQLLGFWYDQGRDALVIWDFLYNHKFFLIGPVTGIEGIFLGPFYYYLLAPFYWLGKGNPVTAAVAIGWMNIGAVFLIYRLGKRIYNKEVGLLAAFLYGFSYNNVVFSRWLANPSPLPFFALLLLTFLYEAMKGRKNLFIPAALTLGLCLQLEAASAVFFIPTMIIFTFWQKRKLSAKILVFSLAIFGLTLLPQLIFNFRHEGILFQAFRQFLVSDKSFTTTAGNSLILLCQSRLRLYFDVFFDKIAPQAEIFKYGSLALFSAGLFFFRRKIFSLGGKFLDLWLLVPMIGFFFYHGNRGYIWDYYFTGFIPAFLILLAMVLAEVWKNHWWGKIIVSGFLILFATSNIRFLKTYLRTGVGITLAAELQALDWIYTDAGKEEFNVDVYVPPQISYSYSYLFRWYGQDKYGREPETKLVKDLYTLEEPDGQHPQLLSAWLQRQAGIGKIVKEYFWSDVSVQKRERIKYE